MSPDLVQIVGATLLALAILHTFSTRFFEHLAHIRPRHAGLWHLLGEVEVVFGFWGAILLLLLFAIEGKHQALEYLHARNFTEPMFVFVVMVIAASKPILQLAARGVDILSAAMPLPRPMVLYFLCLSLLPLLGSFITEPAAMTVAALMLGERIFAAGLPQKVKYVSLGVLFVNVSIGGALTSYAAPPVLMVAGAWGWDTSFMISNFGWKAALAVVINACVATMLFRRKLARLEVHTRAEETVPPVVIGVHLAFLVLVVLFAHYPEVFVGMFLFFLGYTTAYPRHQSRLILREGLLVGFFLGGLVVLGGLQQWWLQPLLMKMDATTVFFGAAALTAVTDNAALTYLGSQVEGLSDGFKYALVSGAIAGGGLTVIANAPNPAGLSILRKYFDEQTVSPIGLLLAALFPTAVAVLCLHWL